MDIPEENAAHEGPTLEEIFLQDCSLWGSHAGAQGRSSREKPLCTDLDSLPPTPPASLLGREVGRGVWIEGVKLSLGKGARKRGWVNVCLLFSTTQICD